MIKIRVFYNAENYNPNRSYFQNQNRLARCKVFENVEEAKAFAETVNCTGIYTTTGKCLFRK